MKMQRVVRVYDNGRLIWESELTEPIEFGRDRIGAARDIPVVVRSDGHNPLRVSLALAKENYVSGRHVLLTPVGLDSIELTNLSQTNPVYTDRSEPLPRDEGQPAKKVFSLAQQPLLITLRGDNSVKAIGVEYKGDTFESISWRSSLAAPSMAPRQFMSIADLAKRDDHESLQDWLGTLIEVLQSAANSNDFFQKAAQAVVKLVGMDSASVLLRRQNKWEQVATAGDSNHPPSQLILDSAQRRGQTVFRNIGAGGGSATMEVGVSDSLLSLDAVVAAPFFNERNDVLGIVYGERTKMHTAALPHISKVDATLVTALAHGVEIGLRRVENEHKLIEAQVRFEQFFGPELARELASDKDLLKGASREISVLFCDIRSFSAISEKLGVDATLDLVGEFLDLAASKVIEHEGVVVDFIGDELVAMWGAPKDQPDHAQRAVRAGLDILAAIEEHDPRWIERIGKPLRAGVGINSGEARVGNIGTSTRFKYGPLGSMVNLASRVQGANKYFKTNMLITENTRLALGEEFHTRRIRKVRVVNIDAPIDLYEVWTGEDAQRQQRAQDYEDALALLEKGDYREAAQKVVPLIQSAEPEGPAVVLAAQALQFATNPDLVFCAEWTLPGK